jgi:hypothetical protein
MTTLSTTTAVTTAATTSGTARGTGRLVLVRAAAGFGLAAAAANVLVAVVARTVGIPLEVGGEPIPPAGFATLTVVGALVGLLLAAAMRRLARRPARTFTVTTVVMTVLSLVPDVIVDATVGSKLVLMLTHLVAAAIVIPALAARLPRR